MTRDQLVSANCPGSGNYSLSLPFNMAVGLQANFVAGTETFATGISLKAQITYKTWQMADGTRHRARNKTWAKMATVKIVIF